MGVLNVTPDSFSDGGRFLDHGEAVSHGRAMVAEGAAILDVGGESTRPGATPVGVDEEVARLESPRRILEVANGRLGMVFPPARVYLASAAFDDRLTILAAPAGDPSSGATR